MKLLKTFIVLALIAGTTAVGNAGNVRSPRDSRGSESSIDYAGATPYLFDSASSTGPVLISSQSLPGFRGVVYGVIVSSIAIGNYLVFRDSDTANGISSTATIVYHSTDAQVPGSSIYTGVNITRYYEFPVPIRFKKGIVVNSGAATSGGGGSSWTILYRVDNVD